MITLDDDAQRLPRNPCRRLRRALITALSDPQPLPPRRRPTSRLSEPKADRCESDVLRDSRVSARKATYLVLSGANTAARRFETFLIALVITNVVLVIIDSDPYVGTGQGTAFRVGYMAFELFSLLVFIAEYAARLWSCVESPGGPVACCGWNARLRWRLAYASTPLAIIDLASIPPFAFDLIFEKDDRMRGISLIRTLRIISLLRLERSFRSFARVLTVLGNQRSELGVAAFVAAILLLMSAATIYYLENPAQPEHFRSIFSSMWWAVTALTTVGYGDVYPVTTAGKMFGSVVAFLGVGFFALPAGIVGSGFMELVLREKQEKETRRAHELRRRAVERRRRRARGAGHGRLAEGERGRRAGGAGGGGAAGGGGGREGGRGEVEDCDREHDHEEEQEEEEEDGSSRDELETIQAALRALRREQHALAAALLEERASLLQQQHRQRSSGSGWWDQAAAAGESVPAGEPPRYEARSL